MELQLVVGLDLEGAADIGRLAAVSLSHSSEELSGRQLLLAHRQAAVVSLG